VHFTRTPDDQVKVLGETAVFYCETNFPDFVHTVWAIQNDQFQLNSENHEQELIERGFTFTNHQTILTVQTTKENNETILICKVTSLVGAPDIHAQGNLTILGKCCM